MDRPKRATTKPSYSTKVCFICKEYKKPLYMFPNTKKLGSKWKDIINAPESEYNLYLKHYLCDIHFERKWFDKETKQLLRGAIPSLNLGSGNEKSKVMKSKITSYCSAKNCKSTNKEKNITFFQFPGDKNIRAKWIKNLRVETIRHSMYACSLHFDPKNWFGGLRLPSHVLPIEVTDSPDSGKSSIKTCASPKCNSTYLMNKIRFFKFPEHPITRSLWIQNLKVTEPQRTMFACSLHFDSKYWFSKCLLDEFAIPTEISDSPENKPKVKKIYYSYDGMLPNPPGKIPHYSLPETGQKDNKLGAVIYYNYEDDNTAPSMKNTAFRTHYNIQPTRTESVEVKQAKLTIIDQVKDPAPSMKNTAFRTRYNIQPSRTESLEGKQEVLTIIDDDPAPSMTNTEPKDRYNIQPTRTEAMEVKQEELTIIDDDSLALGFKQEDFSSANMEPCYTPDMNIVKFEITEIKTEEE